VSEVKREGTHITLVTWGKMLVASLDAAEALSREGITCEVIDLRSVRPLDHVPIVASVAKTGRALVVQESWPFGGVGAEVVDRIQRECFGTLRAPVLRVTGRDAPMPYNKKLEEMTIPSADTVIRGVRAVLAY
jgi:pyruvate dehydrogenase E1 component beta subunit